MGILNFRRKVIQEGETLDDGHEKMNRTLSVMDLTLLGIAAVIGAGIFSTIGFASYHGGPGVSVLFVLIAITCGFSALCYAEFASRVPQSGSAYAYAYVSFGEVFAWIIGWALILEYAIGNIVVAISWSGYFNHLLDGFGIHLPNWLTKGYYAAYEPISTMEAAIKEGKIVTPEMKEQALNATQFIADCPELFGHRILINLPAFLIVALITAVAYVGIQESKRFSNAMVFLKLLVIALVIGIGFFYVTPENWTPFMPNGMGGVLAGVSAVFFAYIGFDAISTTAEECKNPQQDLPKGMIYALVICTILYILISFVLTGMVSYKELNVEDPLAYVFQKVDLGWISYIISVSAVIAMTSVLLVFQLGQPRIWMSMSRDGLLPKRYSIIHKKYKTPSYATIVTGLLVGIPTLFMPSSLVADLTSIGTLFAFVLVCLGVMILPRIKKQPNKFSLPYINSLYVMPFVMILFYYFMYDKIIASVQNMATEGLNEFLFFIFTLIFTVLSISSIVRKFNAIPILGALSCLYLMIEIPYKAWIGFFIWMAIGLVIYIAFGNKHSKLNKKHQENLA